MTRSVLFVAVGLVGCSGGGGGSGDKITVRAARAPDAVIAYRDGGGAWSTKPGSQTPFTFNVTTGSYTVAVACSGKKVVRAFTATPDELATVDYWDGCRAASATLTVHLLGNDMPSGGEEVRWGSEVNAGGTIVVNDFPIPIPLGTEDLLAARGAQFKDRLVIDRGFAITGDTSLDVDFAGPLAITLETKTVTAYQTDYTYFVSQAGTPILLSFTGNSLAVVVPEAMMGPGDLHVFHEVYDNAIDDPRFVGVVHASRTAPSNIKARPAVALADRPVVSMNPVGAYLVPTATWPEQPDTTMYELDVGSNGTSWQTSISPNVFAALGELQTPDVSTAPGWDPTLGLPVGGTFGWQVTAFQGMPAEQVLRQFPSSEGEILLAGWHE